MVTLPNSGAGKEGVKVGLSLFKIWCGEGDLNPHEIAPASTSSQNPLYRQASSRPKSFILSKGGIVRFHGISASGYSFGYNIGVRCPDSLSIAHGNPGAALATAGVARFVDAQSATETAGTGRGEWRVPCGIRVEDFSWGVAMGA